MCGHRRRFIALSYIMESEPSTQGCLQAGNLGIAQSMRLHPSVVHEGLENPQRASGVQGMFEGSGSDISRGWQLWRQWQHRHTHSTPRREARQVTLYLLLYFFLLYTWEAGSLIELIFS